MAPTDLDRVAKNVADLRMQVSALEVVTKNASLSSTLQQVRVTVRWCAVLVSIALVASAVIRSCGDDLALQRLGRRVDAIERGTKPP